MATTSLPLSQIVDISTSITAASVSGPTYNTGLIVGQTRIVGTSGIPMRVVAFPSTSAMISFGYAADSPEVLAAGNYFAQKPAPQLVYVGVWDQTAVGVATIGNGGENYVVGNLVSISQTGAQGNSFKVTTVGTGGVVTGLQFITGGTGHSVAINLPTTGGQGSGLTLNITTIGETELEAVAACRQASQQWYGVSICNATPAGVLAVAGFVESAKPDSCYFATFDDAASIAVAPASGLASLLALNYDNTVPCVSDTQGGEYPGNAYFDAAVMGDALGLFTGLAGSYYTLNNTTLQGVTTEPLTLAQANALTSANANVLLSYANGKYSLLQPGTVASGKFFDDIIFQKAFVSDLQVALASVIVPGKTVPRNDQNEQLFLAAAESICAKYINIGWISAGVWDGPNILALTTGESLPTGYKVQADSYINQGPAQKSGREAMPVYVSVITNGAVHSLSVAVGISL